MFIWSCDPFVTQFEDSEEAVSYIASSVNIPAGLPDSLNVMTWNIRFGAGRIPWFGDSCGERVILSENEVMGNLQPIIDFINIENPDILLLQEVDVSSKRTGYLDQVQWILDHTDFNYGVYASMWKADFIPSDGLGKVDAGNAILSKWPIENAERIQLPLRGDQDGLTQYFYLRRNILKSKIKINDEKEIYALCTHTTAFATDDTKQKHIDKFYDVLASIDEDNDIFVAGGDLNAIPPNANITDFCLSDICIDESFHTDVDGPHKEGSYFNNFTGELNLIQPFYDNPNFLSAIPKDEINQSINFTHSTWNTNFDSRVLDEDYWDRKLDYIFTNVSDGFSDDSTHQSAHQLSDHAPVSVKLDFPE